MADHPLRTGGCGCGALRYEVAGEPIYVNNCHCKQCQQQTGSTSVVNAFFETEALALKTGETTKTIFKAGSGGDHVVLRCAKCGTAIWSHYPRLRELGLGLRVGTLDDPATVRPDAIIFTNEAMPWVSFPEDIPTFETYYDQSAVLPPERFARLQALVEKRAAQG